MQLQWYVTRTEHWNSKLCSSDNKQTDVKGVL